MWAIATNKQKCRLGSESIVSNLYMVETNPNLQFCLKDQANSLIHFYKRCVSLVIWRWLITKGHSGHHGTKEFFPSFRRKEFQGITKSFVCQTVNLPLGHSGLPCDQIHMGIGPNHALHSELWGSKVGRWGHYDPTPWKVGLIALISTCFSVAKASICSPKQGTMWDNQVH